MAKTTKVGLPFAEEILRSLSSLGLSPSYFANLRRSIREMDLRDREEARLLRESEKRLASEERFRTIEAAAEAKKIDDEANLSLDRIEALEATAFGVALLARARSGEDVEAEILDYLSVRSDLGL